MIRNFLLRYLLKLVTHDQLMTFSKDGKVFVNNIQLTDKQVNNLKEEAKVIKASELWALMTNSLASQAEQTMFEKSTTFNDMLGGKMMLYCIDLQKKIIDKFNE